MAGRDSAHASISGVSRTIRASCPHSSSCARRRGRAPKWNRCTSTRWRTRESALRRQLMISRAGAARRASLAMPAADEYSMDTCCACRDRIRLQVNLSVRRAKGGKALDFVRRATRSYDQIRKRPDQALILDEWIARIVIHRLLYSVRFPVLLRLRWTTAAHTRASAWQCRASSFEAMRSSLVPISQGPCPAASRARRWARFATTDRTCP